MTCCNILCNHKSVSNHHATGVCGGWVDCDAMLKPALVLSVVLFEKTMYFLRVFENTNEHCFQVNGQWVPAPTLTPLPAPLQTAFIVSLDCRNRLAVSGNDGNHPACNTVGFKQDPICEVRNTDDMKALSANMRISGDTQVRIRLNTQTTHKIYCTWIPIYNDLIDEIVWIFGSRFLTDKAPIVKDVACFALSCRSSQQCK